MGLFLTTPQFAKQVGVSKNTVINWEKQGLIQPHHVSPTGRRYYDKSQVEEVLSRQSSLTCEVSQPQGVTFSQDVKPVSGIPPEIPVEEEVPPDG